MIHDCIIMAGGSGTRLWPASSSKRPKQFLPAPGGGTFLSDSVKRALEIIDKRDGRIIIVSGRGHVDLVAEACKDFSPAERRRMALIPEPEAKNTAPAIACGLLYDDWISGGMERNILVLTCDHIIEPLPAFRANAAAAAAFAMQDKLVIFGIAPRRPETGYGYIEAGKPLAGDALSSELAEEAKKHREPAAFNVLSFKEKPGPEQAAEYLKAGNFFWNSGMFAFSSKFMLGEFRHNAPDVMSPFTKLQAPCEWHYVEKKGMRIFNWYGLEGAYREAKNISFDYAIAEKCKSTVMVKADFDWIDIGNWDEYIRLAARSGEGSAGAEKGGVFRIGSGSVFVDSDMPVALIGLEDLIVVIRSGKDGGPATALIAKKGETQKVKDIVQELKAKGRTDLT